MFFKLKKLINNKKETMRLIIKIIIGILEILEKIDKEFPNFFYLLFFPFIFFFKFIYKYFIKNVFGFFFNFIFDFLYKFLNCVLQIAAKSFFFMGTIFLEYLIHKENLKKKKIIDQKIILSKIYKREIIEKKQILEFIKKNKKFLYQKRSILSEEKIYFKKYFFFDNLQKNENCIICQSEFLKKDFILHLNNNNFYHSDCLMNWFNTKFECPLSRKPGCLLLINKIHNL